MTEDWKVGYKRALLAAWAKRCGLECKDPDVYIWEDYEGTEVLHKHLASCGIDPVLTPLPDPVTWEHFRGTFTDNATVHGAKLKVTCRCGQYRKTRTRMDSSLSDLIIAVVQED